MTYLSPAGTSVWFCVTCRERREVIVKYKLLRTLNKNLVYRFHIKSCTQGNSGKRLSLSPCKYSGSVCCRKVVNFTPYRSDIFSPSTIKPYTLIKNHFSHGLLFNIMVISGYHTFFSCSILFRESCNKFGFKSLKSICSLLLCTWCGSYFIALIIAEIPNRFAKLLILCFMTVSSLLLFSCLFHQLHLSLTLYLYLFVGKFDSLKHIRLCYLLHLALNHHNVVNSCSNHYIDICAFQLSKRRVNNKFTINTGNSHL